MLEMAKTWKKWNIVCDVLWYRCQKVHVMAPWQIVHKILKLIYCAIVCSHSKLALLLFDTRTIYSRKIECGTAAVATSINRTFKSICNFTIQEKEKKRSKIGQIKANEQTQRNLNSKRLATSFQVLNQLSKIKSIF